MHSIKNYDAQSFSIDPFILKSGDDDVCMHTFTHTHLRFRIYSHFIHDVEKYSWENYHA